MAVAVSIVLVSGCLTIAAAQEPACSVTQTDGLATYNIEGMSESANQTCDFSWSNQTKHVVAYQLEHNEELVIESSAGRLVTRECLGLVLYEFSCGPKWERKHGECEVVCAEKPLVPTEATATATPSPNHIIVGNEAAIGITVAAVLMILAVIGRVKKSEVSKCCQMLTKKMRRDGPATVKTDHQVPLNKPPV